MAIRIPRPVGAPVVALACLIAAAGCTKDDAKREPAIKAANVGSNTASVRLAPSQGDLATLMASEVAKARSRALKPFAEVRADWCGPCKELEASMNDPRMVDAFKGTYIITLDADEWTGKLTALGLESTSIPAVFELDDKGKATGRKITGGAWAENIPANMAPALKKFFAVN